MWHRPGKAYLLPFQFWMPPNECQEIVLQNISRHQSWWEIGVQICNSQEFVNVGMLETRPNNNFTIKTLFQLVVSHIVHFIRQFIGITSSILGICSVVPVKHLMTICSEIRDQGMVAKMRPYV